MHIHTNIFLKEKIILERCWREHLSHGIMCQCDTCSPFQSRKKGSRPCFSQDMIVFDVVGLFLILNNFDSRCVLMYVTCSTHTERYRYILYTLLNGLPSRSSACSNYKIKAIFFVLLLFYYYYITISVYLIIEIIKKLFELNR